MKCLHQEALGQQAFADIVNEVAAMCNLDHPNLIKLYGVVFNNDTAKPNAAVMMVTELAAHGSLYAHLRKLKLNKDYPHLKQLYSFVYQIGSPNRLIRLSTKAYG